MKMNHSPADEVQLPEQRDLGSQEAGDPGPDQDVGEALPERGGEVGGRGAVAGHLPGDRPCDPAAVERERGDQVEHEQHDVDAGQVGHHRDEPAGRTLGVEGDGVPVVVGPAGGQHPQARAQDRDQEGHDGPRDRDAELDARGRRVLRHLRDPAEQPQVDACDRDPVADRHHGVAELVQEDRQEEQQGADRRKREGGAVVAARQRRLVVVGQPPDEEEQGEEPARIDSDADAEDAHERDRPATQHGLMVGGGRFSPPGRRRRRGPTLSRPAPARRDRTSSCSDGGPRLGAFLPPAEDVAGPPR